MHWHLVMASTLLTASLSCPVNQYTTPTGACAQCPFPEHLSTGAGACFACAPGTRISGTACIACTAGTFSSSKGSTACQSCPLGTGSIPSSTACVRCDAAAKLANGITSCVACAAACIACTPGRYNDGNTKKCTACAAGKFSAISQAVSPNACTACPVSQTTLPTTTAATACIACTVANLPVPRSANYAASPDPLVCDWKCNAGYTRFNFSETTFSAATYTALGYSTPLSIFHNIRDFCCEPSSVATGMYLCGTALPSCTPACGRTSDGGPSTCPAVANAHFVDQPPVYKFNRCSDWVCDDLFFLHKTTNICTAQPACVVGFTNQRDPVTGIQMQQPSGAFLCVPCSQCVGGSETATTCTKAVDTVCRLCSPTAFSYQGSRCSETIPLGYSPVRIRLTTVPVFQGRPSMYFDGTPLQWDSVDLTQGAFFNSFTPCQPISSTALMFAGGDEACDRTDRNTLCTLPECKTQCRPWNGTDGWFRLKTGACSKCVYDTSCTTLEYTDMTTCGPTTAPRCMPCPIDPLPNALSWVNPGRTPFAGPYACDFICRDGFTKGGNYSCIRCPSLPANSKITGGGCNWVCSLGFVQDRGACIPCVGVPTSCGVGYYLGYTTSQCARCLPCSNLVAGAVFTSSGQPNGPNTCGMQCLAGMFVSPGYGFDIYNNPVACDRCSSPVCVAAVNYFNPCSPLADAECVACDDCGAGTAVFTACTPKANTVCTQCKAPPSNAIWVGSGCNQWTCNTGFLSNTTACVACQPTRDCAASDSFEEDNGCGRCVPCDIYLLLLGQCFNGDGQCGVSYWCNGDLSFPPATPAVTPTPQVPVVTVEVASVPVEPIYASLATLTLNATTSLTTPLLAALTAEIAVDCGCEATVVAITQNNVTTFCLQAGCQANGRRLLGGGGIMVLDITLVSQTLLSHPPPPPVWGGRLVKWQAYQCEAITDPLLIGDRRRLAVHFKRSGVVWETTPSEGATYYLVLAIAIIAVAAAIGVMCGASTKKKHKQVEEKFEERQMLLPVEWGI